MLSECRDFHIFTIERDEEEINALMQAEKEFWKHVESKTPVNPDGTVSTSETIGEIYPESGDETVTLFAFDKDLKQYVELNAQIKELEKLKDEFANRVKAFMGEAGKGESDDFKVSWTSSERKTFDTKKFVESHPDTDLTDFYKTTTTRIFKVTTKKEK